MKARVVPFDPQLRSADGRRMGEGRSKGTHLSQVLRYIREKLGDSYVGVGNSLFAAFGFMFELWVEKAIATWVSYEKKTLVDPGESCVDSIWMTPDRFDPEDGEDGAVYEFKVTWKSLRKVLDADGDLALDSFQEHFWYWLSQVMAYCHAMGTTRAYIVALFINGDYSFKEPNGGPQFLMLRLEFSPEEIEANWRMVKREARQMEKEGRKGE